MLTHTRPLPPPGAGVRAAFAPFSCGGAVTTIGVAVTEGLLFCFFVLPTSTTGELLVGVAVALAGAAFGEEISYRGYLTLRAADVGGRATVAFWLATLLVSVLFGYGHYYKGPAGILDSSVAGFVLGSAYLLTGRNLWAPVLAHGFIDTVGVIVGFFGWEG